MNFTNIDSAREDIYWDLDGQLWDQFKDIYWDLDGQLYVQVDDQVWNQVDDQLNWKVYGQINLIKSKIRREINK
jgi:uncharacterized protein YdeI (BOF family)